MSRKSVINMFAFGVVGAMLSFMGYPCTTWQFWVVVGLCSVIQINSMTD